MKTFLADKTCFLRDFTDEVYPQGSFAFAALLRAKDIKVNGVKVGSNVTLKRGDTVVYYTTPKQEEKQSHNVIYEDENLLVTDKFAGVSAEGLQSELKAKGDYRLCHRLDRNTSGLLLFAKNDEAEAWLLQGFKDHTILKTYLCYCRNAFKVPQAVLTAYAKKDEKKSLVEVSLTPKQGFVKMVTEYRVLKPCGDIALVEVKLHTGRTHQIRAHMAKIGCPVLGDEKYGDEALNAKYGVKRQLLVAKYLELPQGGCLGYLAGKRFESGFTPEVRK